MEFMTTNDSIMEGTLATAFGKAVVVAIADFMDDGSGYRGRKTEKEESATAKTKNDALYWLGGDCFRASAASSLATIVECSTMKTDNTTTTTTSEPPFHRPAIVSPCKAADDGDASSSHHGRDVWNSGSGYEVNPRSKYNGIISRYQEEEETKQHQEEESSSSFSSETPYQYSRRGQQNNTTTRHSEFLRRSSNDYKTSTRYNLGTNYLCGGSTNSIYEDEPSTMSSSTTSSSWCGGVPSYFDYDADEEKGSPPRHPQHTEFSAHRQYAFDEEDGTNQQQQRRRPAVVEDDKDDPTCTQPRCTSPQNHHHTEDDATTVNDANSVMTGMTSVQSFMMINRPHTVPNPSSMVSKSTHRNGTTSTSSNFLDTHSHLHQLISSSQGGSTTTPGSAHNHTLRRTATGSSPPQTMVDENNNNNNPFDNALTEPLMRKLQKHLPYGKRGDSFWLQYSLIRDGASLESLLGMVSSSNDNVHSVLAIETVEGEVFGAFLTSTWKRSQNQWFGGGQSFLWTTTASTETTNGDSTTKKSNNNNNNSMRVFSYSFANSYVQLCDRNRLLVGSGDNGFGLALERDLLRGTSFPCTTFDSPSLSTLHSDGSTFEIRNLEVWTLTACLSMVENPSEGLTRVHRKHRSSSSNSNINKENVGPAPPSSVNRNRKDRRHNSQRKKNRNKYASSSSGTPILL